jgi:hypothetical protein
MNRNQLLKIKKNGYVSTSLLALILGTLFIGCSDEALVFTEVKRIDEKITESDLKTFLRIINSLPEKRLPTLQPVFALPPEWQHTRTLPVHELVSVEIERSQDGWNVEKLARSLKRNRVLQRALRREEMTPEQFIGLTLTLGLSLSRNTLRGNQDLNEIVKKGEKEISSLKKSEEPFNTLSEEERHDILRQAIWITRVDRTRQLKKVPPENMMLVRTNRELLTPIFPTEFTTNPLDRVVDLLKERGVPFEDTVDSNIDDQIEWSKDDAVVGNDLPDPEFETKPTPESATASQSASE